MVAFREAHGISLRVALNKNRFTKGTNPIQAEKLKFMLSENIACPQYLPMMREDWNLTPAAMMGAIYDSEIPMSEHIRKEIFHTSFTKFSSAIQAEPSLIVDEIRKHCARFEMLFGTRY